LTLLTVYVIVPMCIHRIFIKGYLLTYHLTRPFKLLSSDCKNSDNAAVEYTRCLWDSIS